MNIKKFILLLLMLGLHSMVQADADPNIWQYLQKGYFKNPITEVDFLKIDAPRRAESGSQVPVSLQYDKVAANGVVLKTLYLLIDANPAPLAATYHLTDALDGFKLATRIRMETDSFVHLVGEATDGKLYMAKREIRASGGCSGPVDAGNAEVATATGKMRLRIDPSVNNQPATATLNIRHPMRTGLQRDLVSQGFVPAYYIQKIIARYNAEPIMTVDLGISISEDPYLKFSFVPAGGGSLEIEASDNEGHIFTHQLAVKG